MKSISFILIEKKELKNAMDTVFDEFSSIREYHEKELEQLRGTDSYESAKTAYQNMHFGYNSALRHFRAVFEPFLYPDLSNDNKAQEIKIDLESILNPSEEDDE